MSQAMNNRQLEQLRETLDSIAEDLCNREQAVDKEQAHLLERLSEIDQRQTHLKTLDELVTQHQAADGQLAEKLQTLVDTLDQRMQAEPKWMSSALESLEERMLEKLLTQQAKPPSIDELVQHVERAQSRSMQCLVEQLTASLQTAISVQLAPLTDDLPDRLASALSAAVPTASTSLPIAMPELARELEKFESRSMASMAARMTAGLQTALATQWDSLTADLPSKIAQLLPAVERPAAANTVVTTTATTSAESAALQARIDELTDELEKVRVSLSESEELLSEALEHAPSATDSNRDDTLSEDALVDALRNEITELRNLLTTKEYDSRIADELRDEVVRLRSEHGDSGPLATADAAMRERLEMATCEIIDLRSQNEELTERVTRMQVSNAAHGLMPHLGQEGLSWEERKKLLLAQLDAEQDGTEAPSPAVVARRLEIDDILKATEAELARRDREIAEMRSLLQQQSDARGGFAVGAAAVAQIIEGDELVQQEREKLRGMQRSWDEKFRQAEIDLSMERAKLARERSHLEEQKQELETALQIATNDAVVDPKDKADPKARKWLSRLGLKEDK